MDWWQALLLGLLQGITEFLPVSSSGHLVLLERLFGLQDMEGSKLFDLILHLATVGAILVAFRGDLLALVRERKDWLLKLVAASAPVAVVYLLLKKSFNVDMRDQDALWQVGVFYVMTGLFLAVGEVLCQRRLMAGEYKTNESGSVSWAAAIAQGMAQILTPLPGVSRSGSTIMAGRLAGSSAEAAMSFSFMLGLIAILGANVLKAGEIIKLLGGPADTSGPAHISAMAVGIGFTAAFVSGLGAIGLLRRLLRGKAFMYFGMYCMVLGAVLLVLWMAAGP